MGSENRKKSKLIELTPWSRSSCSHAMSWIFIPTPHDPSIQFKDPTMSETPKNNPIPSALDSPQNDSSPSLPSYAPVSSVSSRSTNTQHPTPITPTHVPTTRPRTPNRKRRIKGIKTELIKRLTHENDACLISDELRRIERRGIRLGMIQVGRDV
jgi:hypothetical protein